MKRRPIHRGGILSAGYDPTRRWLDVEFDTHRILRCENVGLETAERFIGSASPMSYWKDELEENYTIREISDKESQAAGSKPKKSIICLFSVHLSM